MEKVLAQLDSIISRIPTPATPTDIITDEQHSIVDRFLHLSLFLYSPFIIYYYCFFQSASMISMKLYE
uniref:Uncharacterized protein n=1 Tax=Parascaris equorum TaxID=6256 RepID=A0A914RSJ3_PAREQ